MNTNDDVMMREQLSALADGQLQGEDFARAVAFACTDAGREQWRMHHLVGDVLRSAELAAPCRPVLLDRLRERLAQEPLPQALAAGELTQVAPPSPALADAKVANAGVFQWKMVAGLASMAAVAAIGWGTYAGSVAPQGGGAQLASSASSSTLAVADGSNGSSQQVMLRDPRLDELLAAHRQFGSTSSLQMPAEFLRNASFAPPAR